jgi:hypothetical protein
MDINKKIVKALLEKNYVDAKESVFKNLYAKASLLLDEERVGLAEALFNEDKKMGIYSDGEDGEDKKETKKKKTKNEKPSMYEETEEVSEEVEQIDEVSPPGMEKMTGSKKAKSSFHKQYGKRGKEVMYATAWKQYNKKKAERD